MSYGRFMGTVHEDGAKRMAGRWDSDPQTTRIISACSEGIRTGRWSRDYVDAIGQIQWGGPSKWPRHQVAAFARLHYFLMKGAASMLCVDLGMVPYADAERNANTRALRSLPEPFRLTLTGCSATQIRMGGWNGVNQFSLCSP